jgi:hypothetical protein
MARRAAAPEASKPCLSRKRCQDTLYFWLRAIVGCAVAIV